LLTVRAGRGRTPESSHGSTAAQDDVIVIPKTSSGRPRPRFHSWVSNLENRIMNGKFWLRPGAAAALAVALLLGGEAIAPSPAQAAVDIVVGVAPPAPIVEQVGPPPTPGYVWLGGYWNWVGGRHVWVPGHWSEPRPGYRWVDHRWEHGRDGYHFHEGHWERR